VEVVVLLVVFVDLVVLRGVARRALRSGVVPRFTLPGVPQCAPRGVTHRRGVMAMVVASTMAVALTVGAKPSSKVFAFDNYQMFVII
jgi:hypothetical protein